ncbi:MAG: hypothetical protein IIA44_11680, partial [Acidobacteria bacterium]|nr:hypothetical protein [Acidobacteriota bacterium]
LLHEPLHIDDSEGLDASGMFAGPFTNDGKIYTLTSESITPMDWEVTVTQDGSRWLDINGGGSDSGQITNVMEAVVDVRTNATSLTLPPGSYTATLLIENQTTGYEETRAMTLEIEEPLNVAPETWDIETVWSVPADPPLSTVFEMSNVSATDVSYTVTSSADWFVLEDEEPISGLLEPFELNQQTVRVTVETNDAADDLDIGLHEATITFGNDSAGSEVTRTVNLNVRDPLKVDPEAATEGDPSFEWRGPVGGPFASTTGAVSVENVGSITVFY